MTTDYNRITFSEQKDAINEIIFKQAISTTVSSIPIQMHTVQEYLKTEHIHISIFNYQRNAFFAAALPLKIDGSILSSLFTPNALMDTKTMERYIPLVADENGTYTMDLAKEMRIKMKNCLSDSIVRVGIFFKDLDDAGYLIYPRYQNRIHSIDDFRVLLAGEETILVIPPKKLPTLENFSPEYLITSKQKLVKIIIVVTLLDDYKAVQSSLGPAIQRLERNVHSTASGKVVVFGYKFKVV